MLQFSTVQYSIRILTKQMLSPSEHATYSQYFYLEHTNINYIYLNFICISTFYKKKTKFKLSTYYITKKKNKLFQNYIHLSIFQYYIYNIYYIFFKNIIVWANLKKKIPKKYICSRWNFLFWFVYYFCFVFRPPILFLRPSSRPLAISLSLSLSVYSYLCLSLAVTFLHFCEFESLIFFTSHHYLIRNCIPKSIKHTHTSTHVQASKLSLKLYIKNY